MLQLRQSGKLKPCWRRKAKRINGLENGKHSTYHLNGTTQLTELCMSIGTKGGLAQKEQKLMDCNSLPLQQRMSQLLYLKKFDK